ncbi:MAG TPA: helix-turn-helix transcriptional regulator [Streptosporangiaceae bacterium]|jgi:transcriptional regulator with XRE-family HTH domain
MSDTYREVAAEVRASLARANLSGAKAATRLGWKQQYISRRLSGNVPFDVSELLALADLLNMQVTDFFRAFSSDSRKKLT